MSHYFVTGTDTDVGKTIVTALLVKHLQTQGSSTVFKPAQTGGTEQPDGSWSAPDVETVLRLTRSSSLGADAHYGYCYEPPCSPHFAAARADRPIEIHTIQTKLATLTASHDSVIVEGAGGVAVPLSPTEDTLDLMKALDLPVVLVCRATLGTLNHTLLSVAAIRNAGLPIHAIIMNQFPKVPWSDIEQNNLETLRKRTGIPVIGPIPFIEALDSANAFDTLYDTVKPLLIDIFD